MTCTVQVTPVMADTVTPAEPFPPRTRFLQQRILWHLSLVAMVMSSSRWCGSVRHNWTGADTCRYACSLFCRLNVIRDGLNGTTLQPNELIQLMWWETKVRCDVRSRRVFQGMSFNGRFVIFLFGLGLGFLKNSIRISNWNGDRAKFKTDRNNYWIKKFRRCLNSTQPLPTVNCDITQILPSAGQNVKLQLVR